MTVDIPDTTPGTGLAVPGRKHHGLDIIHEWAEAASSAAALVQSIINTPFVPDSYRPRVSEHATPEQRAQAVETAVAVGTAAVLQGAALRLDPLTAMQQIIIIHGRPSMYAKLKVALVRSAGHDVWTEDSTENRAVVCGRRAGSDKVERVTVTIQQAQKAGWTRNPTYRSNPSDMLWARASGRVCDRVAPDVVLGLDSVETVEDDVASGSTGPAAGTTTVRARAPRGRVEPPAVTASTGDIQPMPDPYGTVPLVTDEGDTVTVDADPAEDTPDAIPDQPVLGD